MKSDGDGNGIARLTVAPYTGAWIEISFLGLSGLFGGVAPYTGAWIEILRERENFMAAMSHPTRVRGLKYHYITLM